MTSKAISKRAALLSECETAIGDGVQKFFEVGNALIAIRDDELWREAGCESWSDYLQARVYDRFGLKRSAAMNFIQAADLQNVAKSTGVDLPETQKAVRELGRLAPDDPDKPGTSRRYSAIEPAALKRVIERAESNANGHGVTQKIMRAAVDDELGIDRKEIARKAARKHKELMAKLERSRKEYERSKAEHEREDEQRKAEHERAEEQRKLDAMQLSNFLTDPYLKMHDVQEALSQLTPSVWQSMASKDRRQVDSFAHLLRVVLKIIDGAPKPNPVKKKPTPKPDSRRRIARA